MRYTTWRGCCGRVALYRWHKWWWQSQYGTRGTTGVLWWWFWCYWQFELAQSKWCLVFTWNVIILRHSMLLTATTRRILPIITSSCCHYNSTTVSIRCCFECTLAIVKPLLIGRQSGRWRSNRWPTFIRRALWFWPVILATR